MEFKCLMCGCTVFCKNAWRKRQTLPNFGNCHSCGMKIVNANRFGKKSIAQHVEEGLTLATRLGKNYRVIKKLSPAEQRKASVAAKVDQQAQLAWKNYSDMAVLKSLVQAERENHV